MARGKTLIKLLDDYRALARLSLNPAQNIQVRDTQVNLLQRTQTWLWEDFDWPHMMVERQQPLAAGQRYYDPPQDMLLEKINSVEVFANGCWRPLRAGIDGPEYSIHNSDLDEREWPPCAWKLHEDENVEIWPISDQNADPTTRESYLKFTGIRNLNTFVADTDRADLDDRLIVGYAAAETLAATGAKDAQLKLEQSNKLYARLRGGLTKSRTFKMFGIGADTEPRRMTIGSYRSPWGND